MLGFRLRTLCAASALVIGACGGARIIDGDGDGESDDDGGSETTSASATSSPATSSPATSNGSTTLTGGNTTTGDPTTTTASTSTTGPVDPPEGGPWCSQDPVPGRGDTLEPEVDILEPSDGTVFPEGADFLLVGHATDNGCIENVVLYLDGNPVFILEEPPLEIAIESIPIGTYVFYLLARDSAGNEGVSEEVTIFVQ